MDKLIQFKENLHQQLLAHSFEEVRDVNGTKIAGLYVRMENPVLYILGVYDQKNQTTARALEGFTNQRLANLKQMYCEHLVSLGIFIVEDTKDEEEVEPPLYIDERIHSVNWRYVLNEEKIVTPSGQPDRLLGIEKLLVLAVHGEKTKKPFEPMKKGEKPWVCMYLLGICALLLGYTMFSAHGESFIDQFGLSRSGILRGEYYRFFTSMFLHSGIGHLVSNCIFLYYFGFRAEYLFGRWRFLVLYFGSGLMAGAFSIAFHDVLAIGASGAIYGLMGAMLILTKKYGPRYTQMNYATMLLLVFSSISFGFLNMGVDNVAHIGGFIGGILIFLGVINHASKNQ